jgi:hypothetical protein
MAGGLHAIRTKSVQAAGWTACGSWVDVFAFLDKPPGSLQSSEDWVQLPTGEAGQLHEFVAVSGLGDVVKEDPQHDCYGNGHPHLTRHDKILT